MTCRYCGLDGHVRHCECGAVATQEGGTCWRCTPVRLVTPAEEHALPPSEWGDLDLTKFIADELLAKLRDPAFRGAVQPMRVRARSPMTLEDFKRSDLMEINLRTGMIRKARPCTEISSGFTSVQAERPDV